ncbi:MAG TPA: hypothetical protein VND45_05980 [Thermoanaerobaculia bacterium]|jgi:hypothetical protein|nr:hypothetical protein [Thermoanaerobaculia bacterium]
MTGAILKRDDRELMKRLTIVLAFLFVFTAAFNHLVGVYSEKFFDRTATARWIWARHNMSANEPLAFFAAREIALPPNRVYTRLKLIGDPEYTLYVNGSEVAGRRVGEDRKLDYYDISSLVQTGRNRIVVAVRAPQGAGGLLAALDIAPETENWVVTDGQWRIYRQWDPLILQFDIAGQWERPAIVGEPPIGRWNYLRIARRDAGLPPTQLLPPKEGFSLMALLPKITTQGGIAVATAARARATAYDFGFTQGRVRLTTDNPSRGFSRLVQVRFANASHELGFVEWNLRPIVFAPGETSVTTPEVQHFRYVMAFARDVRAEVLKTR